MTRRGPSVEGTSWTPGDPGAHAEKQINHTQKYKLEPFGGNVCGIAPVKVGTTEVSSELTSWSTDEDIEKRHWLQEVIIEKGGSQTGERPQGFTHGTHAAWLDGEGDEDGDHRGSPHDRERRLNWRDRGQK